MDSHWRTAVKIVNNHREQNKVKIKDWAFALFCFLEGCAKKEKGNEGGEGKEVKKEMRDERMRKAFLIKLSLHFSF